MESSVAWDFLVANRLFPVKFVFMSAIHARFLVESKMNSNLHWIQVLVKKRWKKGSSSSPFDSYRWQFGYSDLAQISQICQNPGQDSKNVPDHENTCKLWVKQPFGHDKFPQLQVWYGLRRRTQSFSRNPLQIHSSPVPMCRDSLLEIVHNLHRFYISLRIFFVPAVDKHFLTGPTGPAVEPFVRKVGIRRDSKKIISSMSTWIAPFPFLSTAPPTSKSPASPLPRQALLLSRLPRSGRPGTKGTHWVLVYKLKNNKYIYNYLYTYWFYEFYI